MKTKYDRKSRFFSAVVFALAFLTLGVTIAPTQVEAQVKPLSHLPCTLQTITLPSGSTWTLCVAAVSKFGLIVTHASFRKNAVSPFLTILYDGRLGEIFVPYHPGSPRFGDISGFNFPVSLLSTADCPSPRVILGGRICRETRDSGLAWRNDSLVRRGREVVYWAVLAAANYDYIMEWSFRDDGTIAARAGSTGPKLGGPDDTRGHMHTFTWRLDFDMNGPSGDSAHLTSHVENLTPPSTAADSSSLIATEGRRFWSPTNFTTLELQDSTLVNSNGRPVHYELVPSRTGTPTHSEPFTQGAFWVTAFNATQLLARDLPAYVNGQSTNGTDIIVWYTAGEHHETGMRDEDRQTVPVLWTGFELQPQNLFAGTPFYPGAPQ